MEDSNGWEESEIPSNWQFKVPHRDPPVYTNRAFPWKRLPLSTNVPSGDNPTACYRVPFDIPLEWVDCVARSQRELFLILHGAGSGVDIFVNGKHVGYGQDSMTGGYL
jgi:beta-galactosidase